MNKYIMINHGVGQSNDWDDYFSMLHEKGYIIGGSALDNGISLENNRFDSCISETVTGYIAIEVPDIDTAKSIMVQSPIHISGGTVELFTLV